MEVDTWLNWLPEQILSIVALVVIGIAKILGVQPIESIRSIKRGIFDLGAMVIQKEACEAANRSKDLIIEALEEALERERHLRETSSHEQSEESHTDAIGHREATSLPSGPLLQTTSALRVRSVKKRRVISRTSRTPT